MNKLEADYAIRLAGSLWSFEVVTLKLAADCRYTPDFMVINREDGVVEFHEVKGHWRDDAKVKLRVAAEKFPMFRFFAAQRDKGCWTITAYGLPDAA